MAPLPLALGLLLCAQEKSKWEIVRGAADHVGSMSYERIGETYLKGADWKVIRAEQKGTAPNRLVIGTASDNAAVEPLAKKLGIQFETGAFRFHGERFGPGTGLIVWADDPDGDGELRLFTGADAEGVFAGFTVRCAEFGSYQLIGNGREIRRAPFLSLDLETARVVRLDRDFEYLRASLPHGSPRGEVSLRLAQGLGGYLPVYREIIGPQGDLASHMDLLLCRHAASTEATLERFRSRDLEREILQLRGACVEKLGRVEGPAPVYYTLVGEPDGTNARTFACDPPTGRTRVLLNLAVLRDEEAFRIAVVHETIHTLQPQGGSRLVDRALKEGVATYLSGQLLTDVPQHKILMWTQEQFQSAEKYRKELVDLFRRSAESVDPRVHHQFLNLDGRLEALSEAPSRSGYYVAWLAARSWHQAHPKAKTSEILTLSPEEALRSLGSP